MTLLQTNGCWTWFNWPEAIYDAATDCTYFSWIETDGDLYIGRYFHATQRWQARKAFTVIEVDDHDNPALLMLDPDGPNGGKLLMGASQHNGINYTKVWDPRGGISRSPSAWTQIESSNASYCHLFQMNNSARTVYNVYRWYDGVRMKQYFRTSTDGGATWSGSRTTLIDNGVGSNFPYLQARQTAANRIDFLCTNGAPNLVSCNMYHFYMLVASDGTRSFYKTDGTLIGGDAVLPIDLATEATVVWDGTTAAEFSCDPWDFAIINGVPVAAISTYSDDWEEHTYRLCKFTGGTWNVETITDGGTYVPNWIYSPGTSEGRTYSGGFALDTSSADIVYVGKKYGSTDFRTEKWVKSGSWAKAADISGNTSSKNCRPRRVNNSPTPRIMYWRGTYTSYVNYATDVHVYPDLTIQTAYSPLEKPDDPEWQTDEAPPGVKGYLPFVEGAGAVVEDFAPGGKHGTVVGTPDMWDEGDFGPEMSGWSATKYVAIDPTTQILGGTHPFWVAVLFKNTGTSVAGAVPISQGNSGDTSGPPYVLIDFNAVTTGNLRGVISSDGEPSSLIITAASQPINNGEYHVAMFIAYSTSDRQLFLDGVLVGLNSVAQTALVADLLTIGALRRGNIVLPFEGTVVAAAFGNGDYPDAFEFSVDWLTGEFAAIRTPPQPDMDRYYLTSPAGSVYDIGPYVRAEPGPDFGESELWRAMYAENAAVDGAQLAYEHSGVRRMIFPLLLASDGNLGGLDGLAVRLRHAARPGGATIDIKPEGVDREDAVRFDILTGRLLDEYDLRHHRIGRQLARLELDVQPFGYLPTMILLASAASVGLPGVLAIPGGSVIGDVPGLAEIIYTPTVATQYPSGSWIPNAMMWALGGRPSFTPFGPPSAMTVGAPASLITDAFAPEGQARQALYQQAVGTSWDNRFTDSVKIAGGREPAYRGRHRLWAWWKYAPSWGAPILVSADVSIRSGAAMGSAAPIATVSALTYDSSGAPYFFADPAYQLHDMGEITVPQMASGVEARHYIRFWTRVPTWPAAGTTLLHCGGYWLQPLDGGAGVLPDGLAQPSLLPGGWQPDGLTLDGVTRRKYVHDTTNNPVTPMADAHTWYRGDDPRVGASTIRLDICGAENRSIATWPLARAQPGRAAVSVRYRPRFVFIKGI